MPQVPMQHQPDRCRQRKSVGMFERYNFKYLLVDTVRSFVFIRVGEGVIDTRCVKIVEMKGTRHMVHRHMDGWKHKAMVQTEGHSGP